jgi:hypothetical protein
LCFGISQGTDLYSGKFAATWALVFPAQRSSVLCKHMEVKTIFLSMARRN